MSHSKAIGSNNLLGLSTVSSYWKRNDAVGGSRPSGAAARPHSSAIDNYSTTAKAKYHNTFAYRGTSVSKDGLRSITSAGMVGPSKLSKGPSGQSTTTARQDLQPRSKNSRALRGGVGAAGTSRLHAETAASGAADADLSSRTRLRLSKPYEGGEAASRGAANTMNLLKNQREASMTEQLRARDRHASTVMSATSIRHTIHSSKPSSRHQMALRNREKSASTAAQLRQPGQGTNQAAPFKKLRDIREIRDATSAAEVRQIMDDVKARYRNSSNNVSIRAQVPASE